MWEINTKERKVLPFEPQENHSWSEPFFFIQGADCQFGLISRYILHEQIVDWEREKALSEAIVKRINQMEPPPRFFIICGDMVDAYTDQDDRPAQEKAFKEIFGKVRADVPVLCVCGNHDVGNTPTPVSVNRYRGTFGDDFYSFLVGGVLFITINSQYLHDSSHVPELADEHTTWMDQQLLSAKVNNIKRIIVFQHIPWFLKASDEPDDDYFNIKQSIRNIWLPKFQAAGVEGIFCGHYHRNAGGDFNGMPVVVTSAIGGQLGDDVSGARIVTVLENTIQHQYYPIEELPLKNVGIALCSLRSSNHLDLEPDKICYHSRSEV